MQRGTGSLGSSTGSAGGHRHSTNEAGKRTRSARTLDIATETDSRQLGADSAGAGSCYRGHGSGRTTGGAAAT
eukprot:4292607-Prymnesium_polylepis.1